MVTLYDTRDRTHPRAFSVGIHQTIRTDADGTVSVDDAEHVETLKTAGFREAEEKAPESDPETDETDTGDDDLDDLTHGELKELAEEAGIADEIDLRSKASIAEALREHTGE